MYMHKCRPPHLHTGATHLQKRRTAAWSGSGGALLPEASAATSGVHAEAANCHNTCENTSMEALRLAQKIRVESRRAARRDRAQCESNTMRETASPSRPTGLRRCGCARPDKKTKIRISAAYTKYREMSLLSLQADSAGGSSVSAGAFSRWTRMRQLNKQTQTGEARSQHCPCRGDGVVPAQRNTAPSGARVYAPSSHSGAACDPTALGTPSLGMPRRQVRWYTHGCPNPRHFLREATRKAGFGVSRSRSAEHV